MTARQPAFISSFLAVLLMAAFVFQPCVMAQEQSAVGVLTDEELQRLVEVNASLEDQIQTAHIRCKYLLYIGVTREIPEAEVIKALDSLEEQVNAGGFQALDKTLSQLLTFAKSSALHGRAEWCDAEIIIDGGRIKNRLWKDGAMLRDSAFDGDREVQFQVDSRQANVFTGRSNWSMITSDTLRGRYPSLNSENLSRANLERRIERMGESHRLRINSEDGGTYVIMDQLRFLIINRQQT